MDEEEEEDVRAAFFFKANGRIFQLPPLLVEKVGVPHSLWKERRAGRGLGQVQRLRTYSYDGVRSVEELKDIVWSC